MANIEVKLRRGTEAEHDTTNGGFTGAEGEVTVDTTNDTLRVHDGSTAGGIRLAKLSEVSGGTGTVTSVDSGTGLTGGPITTSGTLSIADNGVTFAKMQDINTAKVIGRTTAGSGDPEEVSILDEDAMTSDSATSLVTQQSIKAYVDSKLMLSHDTGWFNNSTGLTNNTTYSFSHTLNTTKLIFQIYAADDASGTNAVALDIQFDALVSATDTYGAIVTNVTTSGFDVSIGAGFVDSCTATSASGFSGKYIRVIAIGFA